jgi:transcriptional regulator with XRE-family HTH domain
VKELTAEGYSQRKIADVIGVDQKTVSNVLREELSSPTPANELGIHQVDEENSSPLDVLAGLAADADLRKEAARLQVKDSNPRGGED